MTTTTAEQRAYGNWWKPVTAGLGSLDRGPTMFLLIQTVLGIIIYTLTNVMVGAVVLVYLIVWAAMMTLRDRNDMTPMNKAIERTRFMRRKAKGHTKYRARLGSGKTPLPGLLAGTFPTEHETGYGNPFALIHYPATYQAAAVLRCRPIGGELHDKEAKDQMVANFGGFNANFGTQPGVSQLMTVIETGPDYGTTATRAVEDQIDPDAPELTQEIMRETAAMGTASNTRTDTYEVVTFEMPRTKKGQSREKLLEEGAASIARRLPSIVQGLTASGAGYVTLCGADEIAETTRIAYDPEQARIIEDTRSLGNEVHIDWDQAGPMSANAEWKHLEHDSGISVTWNMPRAPRGTITHDVLRDLVAPHPAIHRKRVALIKHPIDSGRAADLAESGFNNAQAKVDMNRASAAAKRDARIANAVREEQTNGAGLEDFSLVVTVTVLNAEELPDAVAAIETQLSPSARIGTRMMYGFQDVGFAAGLPLGLDLAAHARVASLAASVR